MAGETSAQQRERYSRHLLLPQVGAAGQEKLRTARVLVVGAGGLGAPVLTYLAAAGVGTLGVIDDDVVDRSNLQRQVIHRTDAMGSKKVTSARAFIADLNPNVHMETIDARLNAQNVFEVIDAYDIVVDGTDNFSTRYLLNDACVVRKKPYVWAAIFQFNAMVSIFHAGHGPCYRCIYPNPPPPGSVPSCAEGGVIGVLPGLVGTTQALETIKLILDVGSPLRGRLASLDGLAGQWEYLPAAPSPHCPSCAPDLQRTAADVIAEWTQKAPEEPKPRDVVQNSENSEVAARDLAEFLDTHAARLIDVRTPGEMQIVSIPGAENIELAHILGNPDVGPKDRHLVLMCRSGVRSAQAAARLRSSGYENVYELTGGVLDWVRDVAPGEAVY